MSFRNLLGTSLASFRISLGGPTIYQGTADPSVTPPAVTGLNPGDAYLRHGAVPGWWFFSGGAPTNWYESTASISGDVTITGYLQTADEIRVGDNLPYVFVNWGEAGAGVTYGSAGLEVDRGLSTNVQWHWNEASGWWEATGGPGEAMVYVQDGLAIGDGSIGSPALFFPSLPGNGMYFDPGTPLGPSIGFVAGGAPRWLIDQTGIFWPGSPGVQDIGNPAFTVGDIYTERVLVTIGSAATRGYSFGGDTSTRMFNASGGEINFQADGTDILRLTDDQIECEINGTSVRPAYSFDSLPTAGMYVNAGTTELAISGGGTPFIIFRKSGGGDAHAEYADYDVGSKGIHLPDGLVGEPSLSLGLNLTTDVSGLYRPTTNTLGFVTGDTTQGRERLRIEQSGLLVADPLGVVTYENLVTAGGDDAIPNKKWVVDNVAGVAGANTEIQFNSGGSAFGASADFTWNTGTQTIGLGFGTGTAPSSIVSSDGLTITGGQANPAGGAGVNIDTGDSGNVSITAGTAEAAGLGGAVLINAGSGAPGTNGGDVIISAGLAGSAAAGNTSISGGSGDLAGDLDGGNLSLDGGAAVTGGTGGNVVISGGIGGSTDGYVEINSDFVEVQPHSSGPAPTVRFHEDDGGSGFYIGLKAPATAAASRTWTLPDDNPATVNGQFITTDALGVLSFAIPQVSADTTPQLSGNLDVQANQIETSTVNGDVVLAPNGSGAVSVPAGTYENNVTADDDIPNKKYVDDLLLGVNQTWQNVTGSRAPATPYTNTTGKPIMVSIQISGIGGTANNTLTVDGVSVASVDGGGTGGIDMNLITIVPNLSVYTLTLNAGAVATWAELR